MSAKHTPGKLIAETKQSDLETNDPRCSIGIVNGKILFTTTIVNAPNNAVRLCKCWNSHDALLEACKIALQAINECDMEVGLFDATEQEITDKLYAAIAQAGD